MHKQSTNWFFGVLFLLVILAYCLYLAPLGFEFWDTGYIPSFSWRIHHDQLPYRDFIYKGPPITLYFHAFWMKILPLEGQFLMMRVINYLLFATQVFLVIRGFFNYYQKELVRYNKWGVMVICFVVSLLNFSPYPWPTTDGLLFVSIAFYLSTTQKSSPLYLVLMALFAMLSALTKQSFYPVPILFGIWISLNHNWRKGLLFVFFCLVLLSIFFLSLEKTVTLERFISQTTGETQFTMILSAGFLNYFWLYHNKALYYGLIVAATILLVYFKSKKNTVRTTTILSSLATATLLFGICVSIFNSFLIGSRIAFLACCIALLCLFWKNFSKVKHYSTLLLLLGISWCSAISMGYPYPILFATGIIATILIVFDEVLLFLRKYKLMYPLVIVIGLSAFASNRYPYREQHFQKLTHDLGSISPKLKGITTTKSNLEKLSHLKKLIQKYKTPYIVAPNMSQAHYLFDDQSILPADWLINTEINRNPEIFITIAKNSRAVIFLEKSFLEKETFMTEKPEDFSVVAYYIYKNFKCIGETDYFIIYQGIQKNEPIPKIK